MRPFFANSSQLRKYSTRFRKSRAFLSRIAHASGEAFSDSASNAVRSCRNSSAFSEVSRNSFTDARMFATWLVRISRNVE